jgi:integrase
MLPRRFPANEGDTTMKLTATTVASLTAPAGKPDHIWWDDSAPSFGVRCRNNRKTFVCQYRFKGETRRESLGDVRKVKLDDARAIAKKRFASVELGVDPKPQPAAAVSSLSLGRVADRYLASRKGVVRPNTYSAAERYYRVHWAPLREHGIATLTRAQIAARLQELAVQHGRVSAARSRAYLSALLSWSVREGLIDSNVAAATNDPSRGVEPRNVVLSIEQLRIILDACGGDDAGIITQLLVWTLCRRDEVSRLSWREVDLDRGRIEIAAGRYKSRRAHAVPLSKPALELLKSVPRRPGTDFVFGPENGSGFSGWSNATKALRARLAKPVDFRLHDLRRSGATALSQLGTRPDIIEAALGHSSGTKVFRTYVVNSHEREVAIALQKWSDAVLGRGGSKVVSLR